MSTSMPGASQRALENMESIHDHWRGLRGTLPTVGDFVRDHPHWRPEQGTDMLAQAQSAVCQFSSYSWGRAAWVALLPDLPNVPPRAGELFTAGLLALDDLDEVELAGLAIAHGDELVQGRRDDNPNSIYWRSAFSLAGESADMSPVAAMRLLSVLWAQRTRVLIEWDVAAAAEQLAALADLLVSGIELSVAAEIAEVELHPVKGGRARPASVVHPLAKLESWETPSMFAWQWCTICDRVWQNDVPSPECHTPRKRLNSVREHEPELIPGWREFATRLGSR